MKDDLARDYRSFLVNECLALGIHADQLPMDMPFNELVRTLLKAKERSAAMKTLMEHGDADLKEHGALSVLLPLSILAKTWQICGKENQSVAACADNLWEFIHAQADKMLRRETKIDIELSVDDAARVSKAFNEGKLPPEVKNVSPSKKGWAGPPPNPPKPRCCRCKHAHSEHDRMTFACTVPGCDCHSYLYPYVA